MAATSLMRYATDAAASFPSTVICFGNVIRPPRTPRNQMPNPNTGQGRPRGLERSRWQFDTDPTHSRHKSRNAVLPLDLFAREEIDMSDRPRWILYGAYGTTGQLILDEALRRGHRPVLAGRDASRLSAVAAARGLQTVALPLHDREAAKRALEGVSVLLNAAGPFFETGQPLRARCLEAGTSYVDVNGEIGDFLESIECDSEARAKGIAIIPGAGFGVVFGEAVSAHVAMRLPDASWLRISFDLVNASTSRGAQRSTASVLTGGGYVVQGGILRKRPTASSTWRLPQSSAIGRPSRFASAPRPELIAA